MTNKPLSTSFKEQLKEEGYSEEVAEELGNGTILPRKKAQLASNKEAEQIIKIVPYPKGTQKFGICLEGNSWRFRLQMLVVE